MFKSEQFEDFIENFALNHGLLDQGAKYLLAVSGGLDSMALFYFFLRKKIPFEVLHFNHGSRPKENILERNLIESICQKYNIKFYIHEFNMNSNSNNFELKARNLRKEVYQNYRNLNYTIVLAHHIDDSFEWSLIQKLGQSQLKSTLGIPLKGPKLIRPFMCVTKKQIENYMKSIDGEFLFDSSNLNQKHLRNGLRMDLILKIKQKFPSYLKHYVVQQNQLARKLGLHINQNKMDQLSITPHRFGGLVLKADQLSLHFDEIFEAILKVLPKGRSKLSKIFSQIEKAILELESENFKTKAHKGPFHLPNDGKLFILHNRIWIYLPKNLELFEDFLLSEMDFNRQSFSQITSIADDLFPNLILTDVKSKRDLKSLPILTLVQKKLKESEMQFCFRKLPRHR